MKSRKYFSLILGAVFLSLTLLQTAGAAIRPSALTVSPMIGAHFFSNDQNLLDRPTYGLGVGYNFTERLATELNLSYVVTETASQVKDDVEYAAVRLDLLYHFPLSGKLEKLVPYVAAGVGEAFVVPEHIANDKNFLVGYGGGAKYFVTDDLALRCDVRHLLDINDDDAQRSDTVLSNFTATAGIFLQFGGREEVKEAAQAAPVETAPVEKAPVQAAPAEIVAAKAVDSDGDGVVDNLDLCPGTAAGVAVDAKGCPVVIDKDRDGVVDAQDKCPGTPANTVVDTRGCPVPVAPVAEIPEPVLMFSFFYPLNMADVNTGADQEKMVAFVKENLGRRFVIEGHTDSIGNTATNMKLSVQRAEKIKAYLVEKLGVADSLVEARGFGENNPIADNSTQEGRRQNRRVDIMAFPQ